MKSSKSCAESMDSCLKSQTFAYAHLYNDERIMKLHNHECCEIYYSVSGGKQFFIEDSFYDINEGDVFFINHHETHYLTQINSQTHERIILSIHPDYLSKLSSSDTKLDSCFLHRNVSTLHSLHLTEIERDRFLYYIHQFYSHSGYGADLLDQANFLELMVFLNKSFLKRLSEPAKDSATVYHNQVDDILTYINQNIQSPLTIEELSTHFFLSSSYLCRIFKASTGTTINRYIVTKRINISKALLVEGHSVNDACSACGFNDYSNFLKAFTKEVGISPKKFAQFNS